MEEYTEELIPLEESNLIILFSGGADSILLLNMALTLNKTPYCLLIDYGQKHVKELDFAISYLKKKKINFDIVKVEGLSVESGLTNNGKEGMYKDVHPMHVPSRNLMFVSFAASYAESAGISEIWYGANQADYDNQFPDCKQEWVDKVNKVLEINGSRKVVLHSPLSGMTKDVVLNLLKNIYGVNQSEMFSGYGD